MILFETCTREMTRKARRPILSWSLMHLKSDSAVKFKSICQRYCSSSRDWAVYHGNVAHLQFGIQALTLSAPQMYFTQRCVVETSRDLEAWPTAIRRGARRDGKVESTMPWMARFPANQNYTLAHAGGDGKISWRSSCKNLNTMPDSMQTDVNLCDTCPCLHGCARHVSRPRSSNDGPDNDSVRVVSPMSSCFTL